jgi:hypothetical protein
MCEWSMTSINLFNLRFYFFWHLWFWGFVVSLFVDVSQGASVQGLCAQSVIGFVRRCSLFLAAIVWKRSAHSEIDR